MRTRSKQSDPIITPGSLRWAEWWNGMWYPWHFLGEKSPSNWIEYNTQTMTDQKTPGYFRAVREGTAIPVSPMTSSKTTVVRSRGQFTLVHARKSNPVNSKFRYELSGSFIGSVEWAGKPTPPEVDGSIALQEALSRAQSDAFDALTFAAEFRKTLEGVITLRSRAMVIFERFTERVRSSTARKRFRGLEMSKILAEIWLEMRYMWRPLVYDMIAVEEALRRMAAGVEDPLQRAYATREGSTLNSFAQKNAMIGVPSAIGSIAGLNVSTAATCTVERSVHAAVGLKVITREISMIDPVVTALELMKWSFILEWFITIGDMLTAFSPFASGQLQYASLATRTTTTYRSNFKIVPSADFQLETGVSQTLTNTKTVVDYARVAATPKPTLALDVNLNVAKILDLVALWVVGNNKAISRLMRHF